VTESGGFESRVRPCCRHSSIGRALSEHALTTPRSGCWPSRGRRPCRAAVGVRIALPVWGTEPRPNGRDSRGHRRGDELLRTATPTAALVTDLPVSSQSCVHPGGRRGGAFLRPQSTPTGVIARRAVSFPTTRGDRRVGALLRQELAGSNPVGGYQTIENTPDKESTWVPSTPDPAPTVFRSLSLIPWPSNWSVPSPQEPEIQVRILGAEHLPWCNLAARRKIRSSTFPATVPS
jgi:hypothetical protein